MSFKWIYLLVIASTGFQIYCTGFEFGLLLFVPARLWFLLTYQGIKSNPTAETIVESLGWIIQLIVLTFTKFDADWKEYLVMFICSVIVIGLIWYEETFLLHIDVEEDEVHKYL